MDRKNFLDIITELSQELKSVAGRIDEKNDRVAEIEIDLVLEKLRKSYDDLSKPGIPKPVDEKPKIEEKIEPPADMKPANIDEDIQKSETEISEIDSDELMLDVGKKVPSINPPASDLQADLFTGQPLKESENKAKAAGSGDSANKEKPKGESLGEKIAENKQEETVADKIQKNKISGLKVAIGINEKFFFINELFNGSLKDYNETIEKLDQANGRQEAIRLLDKLQKENMWDRESDAFKKIEQFIDRKFV